MLPSASLFALQVVHSEDNTAAAGEWPHSSYACGMYGGLWQHGEAHNIVFSDEHASVTNEVGVGGCGGLQRVGRGVLVNVLGLVGWLQMQRHVQRRACPGDE